MGGFMSGFLGAAGTHFDQLNQEERAKKEQQRKLYEGVVFDNRPLAQGGPSDDQRAYARDQLGKLSGPEGKKALQKFGDIFTKISGLHQQANQGQQPQQQGNEWNPLGTKVPSPQQGGMTENLPNGQPAPGTAGSSPRNTLPNPPASQNGPQSPQNGQQPIAQGQTLPSPRKRSGIPSLPPIATDAEINQAQDAAAAAGDKRRLASEQADFDFWNQKGKDLGLSGRDLAQYSATKGQHLPPQEKRIADKGIARPGVDPSTGKPYEGIWDHIVEPDGTETWAKRPDKAQSGVPRQGDTVTGTTIKKIIADGTDVLGPSGKPLTAEEVEKLGDSFRWWNIQGHFQVLPVDPHQVETDIGNRAYITDPLHRSNIATGGPGVTDLGVKRVGSTSTSTPVGIGGTQRTISVGAPGATPQRQTTPQTGTVPNGAQAPTAQSPKPSPRGTLPTPQAVPQAAPQASANDPILPGVSMAQARQAGQMAAPVAAAVTEIFGDPNQPDLHPLQSYAKLADDPKAKERIGKAIQLTLNGFGEGIKDASIGIGAGPVHVSAGGWGTWLDNQLGGPTAAAGAQAQTLRKALNALTPEEKEAYNSTMATMSTMAGLRSISRQSAAMGSLALIERELPKIGLNVNSSKDMYDQLQRTAGAISTFANTPLLFPRVNVNGQAVRLGFTPEMQKRITELTGEMKNKKGGTSPKGNLPSPSSSGDMEYMEHNGATYQRKKGSGDEVPWVKVKKAA